MCFDLVLYVLLKCVCWGTWYVTLLRLKWIILSIVRFLGFVSSDPNDLKAATAQNAVNSHQASTHLDNLLLPTCVFTCVNMCESVTHSHIWYVF